MEKTKVVVVQTEKKRHVCPGKNCSATKSRRYLLCKTCWEKLPLNLRIFPRELSKDAKEKGKQTLRANPRATWYIDASKYVGMLPHLTWGSGLNAVKVKE